MWPIPAMYMSSAGRAQSLLASGTKPIQPYGKGPFKMLLTVWVPRCLALPSEKVELHLALCQHNPSPKNKVASDLGLTSTSPSAQFLQLPTEAIGLRDCLSLPRLLATEPNFIPYSPSKDLHFILLLTLVSLWWPLMPGNSAPLSLHGNWAYHLPQISK
jgi:hypothetical protein